jgi:hypothetical protein
VTVSPTAGFLAWPLTCRPFGGGPAAVIHQLYRLAYEQAQAALRPSWYERCLAPSLN